MVPPSPSAIAVASHPVFILFLFLFFADSTLIALFIFFNYSNIISLIINSYVQILIPATMETEFDSGEFKKIGDFFRGLKFEKCLQHKLIFLFF
jgi:hypothetical protein